MDKNITFHRREFLSSCKNQNLIIMSEKAGVVVPSQRTHLSILAKHLVRVN